MADIGPAHRVQSAAVEYGFPQGHLGHLNRDEEAALQNFRALCAEKGLYKPAEGDKPASHDDATLLRFLRARRFSVKDAFQQFEATEKWREANEIDKLYETIDLQQYDDTRRLYPQWTGRRDKRGIPVYVFEVKHLNSKTMAAYEKSSASTISQAKSDGKTPPKLLRLFALYENLAQFAMPLCTALPDRDYINTPITQSNNIVDISGVGLKQFWNLRGHMQDASTLATAHYPETLDRIFIIGAPSFFPTVWSWIKKWFDPITTSKIFILSSTDMKKTLESFIDPKNIPKKYGGELDFEFGYDGPTIDPVFDKHFEWKTEKKEYPIGPLLWRKAERNGHGVLELVASGSENEVQRNKVIGVLQTSNTERDLMNLEPDTAKSAMNGKSKESSQTLQVPRKPGIKHEDSEGATPDAVFVENGEVVPANRPRLETFVTAFEGTPLSPSYTGPVQHVPDPEPESQKATEKELADGIETPEESVPTEIAPTTETAAPVVNGAEKEKAETPTINKGDFGEKLRSSFENLNLGGRKRDGSLGRSEKESLNSQKGIKARIKEKLVK